MSDTKQTLYVSYKDGKWSLILDGKDITTSVLDMHIRATGREQHVPIVTLWLKPTLDIEIDDASPRLASIREPICDYTCTGHTHYYGEVNKEGNRIIAPGVTIGGEPL